MASRLKIAVLDDYQEVSEAHFKTLDPAAYEVTYFKSTLLPYNHPATPSDVKEQYVQRLAPFDVISTMRERTPFPGELVARLPNLKLLLTTGNKNAALDLEAFRARGIPIAGAMEAGGRGGPDSTTQHCVALILAAVRNLAQDDRSVKTGGWQTSYAVGLPHKVLGTVGLGRLGARVAAIMHSAFGMRVIAWSSNLTQATADEQARAAGLPVENPTTGEKTFKVVSKEELFRTADVVTIQLVLSERSRGIISAADLGLLKPSAIFVNTSRGPLVVEQDLLETLDKGRIRAAALDVFDLEPLPADSQWRTTKWGEDGRSNVLLSPHMGYVEQGTLNAWYKEQVDNILKWKKGEAITHAIP